MNSMAWAAFAAATKKHDILADERDIGAQGRQCELADVDAVEKYRAAVGQVETRHETRKRALAAAGMPDQRQRLARLDRDGDVDEGRLLSGFIGETDIAELQAAPRAADGARAGVRLRRLVEQGEDARGSGDAPLQHRVDTGEALDGSEQHGHGGKETDEAADGDVAGGREVRRQKQDDGQSDGDDHLCGR
jgi:hypothetical protein